ncbi:MAG: hypothetical protein ABIK28_08620, partial [Planctomycetota bacterium]
WRLIFTFKSTRREKTAGFVLPLSEQHSESVQVDAWLGVMNVLGKGMPSEPHMVVHTQAGSSRRVLSFFLRPLDPSSMAVLESPTRIPGMVDITLFKEPSSLDGYNRIADCIQESLSKEISLDRLSNLVEIVIS